MMSATPRGAASAPRISVIIPTYNRSGYIQQAVDSVLQQTVSDVEIIVVDDGSTDDTHEKLVGYGERVRYIATPNTGAAHARNVGMDCARGRYLTFLDSDDLLYPYMLEIEAALLDRYPETGLVYAEMSAFDDSGFFDRYHLKRYHQSAYRDPRVTYGRVFDTSVRLGDLRLLPDALTKEDPELLERRAYFGNIFDWYLTNLVLFTNNVLMRREVIPTVGRRNERLRYFEEFDYTLRITRQHRVCFVDVPTYKLRYHHGQISRTVGNDGRYVWLRKQQALLSVVRRRALEDSSYYERHRDRIDRHVAHLHRAVAVPLMLSDGSTTKTRNHARRARKYLARCRQYGHPYRGLWLLTFAPARIRRFVLSVIESLRQAVERRAIRRRTLAT